LDELDKKTEHTLLNGSERDLKHVVNERLAELLREEELKWYQRAKVKHLLEGDTNTKYYHLLANGRHRKTRIFQLEDGDSILTGDAQLKEHITSYYKNLFGPSEDSLLSLDESQTEDIPQVSDLENEFLTEPFTQEEVRTTIFQMEHNKAPGPDGFPPEFYQVFWGFGNIILLPKKKDARVIQQYKPICLLNVSFKIFIKVTTNRLTTIA
jgi:hypothetical protein